jgi:alpha-tubulin suppressor-like RCC1 family protein
MRALAVVSVGFVAAALVPFGCSSSPGSASNDGDAGFVPDDPWPSSDADPAHSACVDRPSDGPPGPRVAEIAAGDFHACALLKDATLRCWGKNTNGQLGDGTTTSTPPKPVVPGLTGVKTVALGGGHSCATIADDTVMCWGENDRGQLGSVVDGAAPQEAHTPVSVGIQAKEVALGDKHTCALLLDGTVKCWGQGDNGRLGTGATTDEPAPKSVTAFTGAATTIASGASHTCVLVGGGVKCWGANEDGQLGDGTTNERHDPTDVPGITDATDLALGRHFTCVLHADGSISCWGKGDLGQLAAQDTQGRLAPAPSAVTLGNATTRIAAGIDFACALGAGGTLRCWGDNDKGQLGRGAEMTQAPHSDPVLLDPSHCAARLAAASGEQGKFACALLINGDVECWGENNFGQLGDGTQANSAKPVRVAF